MVGTADEVGHHRTDALVGDVAHLGAGGVDEHRAGEVDDGSLARRRVVVDVRLGLQQGLQFPGVVRRKLRVDHQHQRRRADHRDRRDVVEGVERHLLEDAGVHDVVVRHHAERLAIGRRTNDDAGARDAAGPGQVLDHHRLAAERLGERRCGRPHDGVDARACAHGQHHAQGLVGGFGKTRRRPQCEGGGDERGQLAALDLEGHGLSPWVLV